MSEWEYVAESPVSRRALSPARYGDSCPMPRPCPAFPESVWLEIALFSPLSQILLLLRLGPDVYRALVHLLYRRVQVTVSAPALVETLAANLSLPPLVRRNK